MFFFHIDLLPLELTMKRSDIIFNVLKKERSI